MNSRRFRLSFPLLGAALLVFAAAACGGGSSGSSGSSGGGGSVVTVPTTPTPTPTVVPTLLTQACTTAPCSYAFGSDPTGTAVFVNGTQIGVTPLATTPPFSNTPLTVTFGTSTYSATIDQTGSSSRAVFYNSVVDTGTVAMTGNQSVARRAASATRNTTTNVRRGLRQFDRSPAIATNGVYVRYDSSKLTQGIDRIEAAAGARGGRDVLSSVAAIRGRFVLAPAGTDVRTLAAKLNGQPGVIGVYPLHYRVPLGTISRVDPNDAEFGVNNYQWDMDVTQATYAWSLTQGANAKVAIIDTGVDLTQPDLMNKIAYSATYVNGSSDANDGQAQDTNGHGTNVAAIAAAQTNDGIGFAGVGYSAKILAYRIFPNATSTSDEQTADTGDEAAAIANAVTEGADVINLSLGSDQNDPTTGVGFDQAEHDAVEAAIAAGVTVVAASGNGDANDNAYPTVDFPAAYDGVISVGASSIDDNNVGSFDPTTGVISNATESVAPYSNYGPGLGVVAPGGDTFSSYDSDQSDNLHWIVNDSTSTAAYAPDQCTARALPQVCTVEFQGTSQATPHVAGTVALVQSALREHGASPLSPAAMLQLIDGTADNINNAYQGHGRLNTLRAVAGALGVTVVAPAPVPPASSPTQFVAFAYTNSGASPAKPAIADVTYPAGVPVSSANAFRIADIDPSRTTGTFKIGVWLDSNGDGIVDAGDQFGASSVVCTANAKCNPGTIAVTTLPTTGALP